jgi:pimeloyl-ACP methyl ester carboxylesterase
MDNKTLNPPMFARFITPARRLTKARHIRPSKELVYGRLESSGSQVATYQWGNGRTVLLMHGWEGCGFQLESFALFLAETGFRAVAFDAPAHGQSDGIESDIYAFRNALQDVALAFGPVHGIIAHSFGMLATALALRSGLETRKVVGLASLCRLSYCLSRFCALRKLSPEATCEISVLLKKRYGTQVWDDGSADLLANTLYVPALLIHDWHDPEVSFTQSETLAAAWPLAKLEYTSGLGHRELLDDVDVIKRAVAFLME